MTGFEPRRAGWAERNAATKLRKSHSVALTTDLELHWASELTGREIYNLQHSLVKTQIIWQTWWDSQWEWECALCSCENEKEWESVRERSFLSPVVFEGSTVTSSWMSFSEYVTFWCVKLIVRTLWIKSFFGSVSHRNLTHTVHLCHF